MAKAENKKRNYPTFAVCVPQPLAAILEAERLPTESRSAQWSRLMMVGLGLSADAQLAILRGDADFPELVARTEGHKREA